MQLEPGLKGSEELQSGGSLLGSVNENPSGFPPGKKVPPGIDFVWFELEVGGENGSGRETKGIF